MHWLLFAQLADNFDESTWIRIVGVCALSPIVGYLVGRIGLRNGKSAWPMLACYVAGPLSIYVTRERPVSAFFFLGTLASGPLLGSWYLLPRDLLRSTTTACRWIIAFCRRWFRFSLRTLLVVTTGLGCWLGYELHWLRERRRVFSEPAPRAFDLGYEKTVRAPGLLWLFGEPGFSRIAISEDTPRTDWARIKQLFPEAVVEDPLGPLLELPAGAPEPIAPH